MSNEGQFSIISGMQTRSRKAEKALDNPGHMHEYVFKQTLASFHWEMVEIALEGYRDPMGIHGTILNLSPRDHAKTTIYAETIPLWRIGLIPTTLLQVICSTTPLAKRRVRRIGSCIQYNPRYKELFGDLYPDTQDFAWSNEILEVKRDKEKVWAEEGSEERDPTVIAFGITTSVEGGRATEQVFDDIVTTKNSRTEIGRQAISEKFWMSFDPMLLPTGVQRIIGTRYYPQDFYAELIAKFDDERLYTHLYPEEDMPDFGQVN